MNVCVCVYIYIERERDRERERERDIGKKHLTIDLSAPHNDSVASINSQIPLVPFSLLYDTMNNASKFIKPTGKGA